MAIGFVSKVFLFLFLCVDHGQNLVDDHTAQGYPETDFEVIVKWHFRIVVIQKGFVGLIVYPDTLGFEGKRS